MQPLRIDALFRDMVPDQFIPLPGKQAGDTTDPGVGRLGNDNVIGFLVSGEKRLGIIYFDQIDRSDV